MRGIPKSAGIIAVFAAVAVLGAACAGSPPPPPPQRPLPPRPGKGDDVDITAVREVLDTLNLVDLTRGDMIAAGTHSPLRSNDAIHLAVAIRLSVDEIVTYDSELADAAKTAGLVVTAPAR